MIKTISANFEEFIGGRYSLKVSSYLAFAPLLITASILININLHKPQEITPLLAANILALLICTAIFFIGRATIYRNRFKKPVPFYSVLIFGAVIGFAKGFSTGYFFTIFSSATDFLSESMTRAISTTILGIWLVPGLAIFNSLIENFKAERDLLLFQISKQNIRTENQVEVISHSSLLTITDFVNHAKSRLARVSNRDAIKIASEIRSIVDENLRPVSHKIWRREARNFTDYSFRDLLNISTRNYAFSPLIVIPIYTISSFGWMVSHVGILQATIRMLLEGVLTYLILELARRVPVKSNLVAWLRFSFTVIAIGLGNAFFGHLIFSNHFDQHVAPFIIVDIMLVSEVCLLSGILVVALSSHARVKAELNTLLESTTRKAIGFSGTSLLEARELANHLHGEVQNRLLQSALRISAIVTQENRASLTAELDDIERMLSEIESRFQNRIGADVIKELQSIAESWHGIVSVDLIIDDATGANQVLSSMNANEGHDFVQVVSEAVSNSYRHGLASTVSIYIARGSDGIGVRIVDNGIGPVQGKTGLGSKLFDTVTHRNWSLTQRTSGGSELRLQMPTN